MDTKGLYCILIQQQEARAIFWRFPQQSPRYPVVMGDSRERFLATGASPLSQVCYQLFAGTSLCLIAILLYRIYLFDLI